MNLRKSITSVLQLAKSKTKPATCETEIGVHQGADFFAPYKATPSNHPDVLRCV